MHFKVESFIYTYSRNICNDNQICNFNLFVASFVLYVTIVKVYRGLGGTHQGIGETPMGQPLVFLLGAARPKI